MIDRKGIITDAFGTARSKDGKGRRGSVFVRDIIIGKKEDIDTLLQHRIHIDKFTGGVIDGSLFSEETVSGNIAIHIDIENRDCSDAIAGLLLITFRDLAVGAINLGSGYSIGRGFVNVQGMAIHSLVDKKDAFVDFASGSIQDEQGLISRCLQAVDRWGE